MNVLVAGHIMPSGIGLRSADQSRVLVTGLKGCGGGYLAVIDGSPVAQAAARSSL